MQPKASGLAAAAMRRTDRHDGLVGALDHDSASQRLRARPAHWQQLFETVSDLYWEVDVKGRITSVSANIGDIFGVAAEEAIGKRLAEIAGVTIEPQSAAQAFAAIRERRPFRELLYSHRLPDGRTISTRTSGIPMFEDGEFVGYCGVSKDITAELAAAQSLRDSEQRFRELFAIGSDYSWEQDTVSRMVYVSPNFETATGLQPENILGKRLPEFPGVKIDPELGKMVLLAFRERRPFRDFVFSRTDADGRMRWFKTAGAPVLDKDGQFVGYRGVTADVTEARLAEQAARQARQRLEDAVAQMQQPFVVYDADDRIAAFNQAFVELHMRFADAYDTLVTVGAPYRSISQWELDVGFYAPDQEEPLTIELLLARQKTEEEHAYLLRDKRWMQVAYRRLPDGGKVGLWSDVTAIKRAEEERRVLTDRLHHSQRLESLGTLAGGVAHELNNALVPVLSLTKTVARRLPEGGRDRRELDLVIGGAERSRDLVKQILAFSRKQKSVRATVDLAAVLGDALMLLRASLPATIKLVQDIGKVPQIDGNAGQLQQIVVNLVTNSAHAIGMGQGSVTVSLSLADGAIHLVVADTGCGMDQAIRDRIFEPFFTTKEVGQGTGLGLAVVHGIVTEHGGRIEVDSAPGVGTRFDVILPVIAPQQRG